MKRSESRLSHWLRSGNFELTPWSFCASSYLRGYRMRFVLIYGGLLPSSGNLEDKHRIRRAIHPQLARQWRIEGSLAEWARSRNQPSDPTGKGLDEISAAFARGQFRFVPLVSKRLKLVCFLDILFLRREAPGELVRHGGDIDNRMKTLLDSLRVPDASEVQNFTPDVTENPFFCLLEDDALVTGFQVKTERLLEPPIGPENQWDARLVLTAVVRPTEVTIENLAFLGGWL